ncbi:EAL domain-containing protein [Rhodobacterales bacterium HKCCE4037]|nr:EAL domain-containing protein [Rhodobacterales bacterium HKCCE4037]
MPAKGQGLNSIPVRFGLLSLGLGGAATMSVALLCPTAVGAGAIVLLGAGAALVSAGITYLAARKLTAQIEAIRRSTVALASGDFNAALDVDCKCELGDLADNFKIMADRLATNVMRMNVLAYTDPLTRLPNRSVIFHALDTIVLNPNAAADVLFIDLDGFKRINDSHGHEVGDLALAEVGCRIAGALGRKVGTLSDGMSPLGESCDIAPGDALLGRVAGDEFVAILPDIPDGPDAVAVAGDILAALAEPITVNGLSIQVGCSIGIVRHPDYGGSAESLINLADQAMYEAKASGRNRIVRVDEALDGIWRDRRVIEGDLEQAVARGDIHLAFQPRFHTDGLRLSMVEALARWTHPERGPIPPGIFIPIAERLGLMGELGAQVLEHSVRKCRAWLDQGLRIGVSVNVSPTEFDDPTLLDRIAETLDRYDVEPDLLEVEITESMAMGDAETVQDQMRALSDLGVKIAIDDFGTGYSNFARLTCLPYTTIKLDRSLISEVTKDPRGVRMLEAIAVAARMNGQTTVAEGIETQQQFDLLRPAGFDEVQGFHFSRPLSADKVAALVRACPGSRGRLNVA